MPEYRTGSCNIGGWNRAARFLMGVFFLAASLIAWSWMVDNVGRHYRLILILPLYASFLGFYEAYFGFCVYHAARRSYDMR